MVNAAMAREFSRRGIPLLAPESGAEALLKEMSDPGRQTVEVIIGGEDRPLSQPAKTQNGDAQNRPTAQVTALSSAQLNLAFEQKVDTQKYPILKSHVIDGKPVVPFALIAEWFGHAALHANPGLVLQGIDNMRILNGIRLENGSHTIRLFTSRMRRRNSFYEVDLELRDKMQANREVIHSRAKAVLCDQLISPPVPDIQIHEASDPYHRDMRDIYDKILFHGSDLHGLRSIISCSDRQMIARMRSAPAPHKWISEPLRSGWLTDPLVLDSAFQMATIWCFEQCGVVSLPAYCDSYRQYQQVFPSDGITAVMEVTDTAAHKMCANFIFYDDAKRILATLDGYEAIMDAFLYRAFKPPVAKPA
jgi:hypothetical protein